MEINRGQIPVKSEVNRRREPFPVTEHGGWKFIFAFMVGFLAKSWCCGIERYFADLSKNAIGNRHHSGDRA